MKKNIFVIDLDRCIGCKACQVACKQENGVSLGRSRIKIFQIGPTGTYPDLEMYFLPVMCQQCENPPCVDVCPTSACYQSGENGTVYIDDENCIGCKSCNTACPYDINTFNKETLVMDKCDQCAHLLELGELPACVKNCPGSALVFGDINNPESPVSKLLSQTEPEKVYTLRNSGNEPAIRYILRKDVWKDVIPQECEELQGRRKSQ